LTTPRVPFRTFSASFVALGALLLLALPATAACLQPEWKICSEFFKRDAVFIARVLSETTVRSQSGLYDDGWVYRLRVTKVFRGSLGAVAEVFTENSSGRFRLEVGKDYLLLATLREGRFEIDNCGESGLFTERSKTIREIEGIAKASDGVIEAYVESRERKGVAGVQFEVRGKETAYIAVTDGSGRSRLNVRPGTYSVKAVAASVLLIPSYEDPDRIVVSSGGCAQLQFIAGSN